MLVTDFYLLVLTYVLVTWFVTNIENVSSTDLAQIMWRFFLPWFIIKFEKSKKKCLDEFSRKQSESHPDFGHFQKFSKIMVLDEFSTNQPESRPEIPKSTISPVLDEFSRKHSESHPDFLASFNFELKYFYRVPQQV